MGAAPAGAHSMRACRGAMVRRRRLNAYLGFPVTPMLARMFAREVVGTDFRLSRNGDGGRPRGGAQYARVSGSDGATAQAECLPWVSGRTDACWRGVDVTRFSTVEKR